MANGWQQVGGMWAISYVDDFTKVMLRACVIIQNVKCQKMVVWLTGTLWSVCRSSRPLKAED